MVAVVALVALLALLRFLYQRSMRLKSRLQMTNMFTNISHELLTPLTVIAALVERLRELGFAYVSLDLVGFRSGAMNEVL